jgi:hypothetical protein
VTEGGVDEAGVFHKIPRIDDSRLAEIFAREALAPSRGRTGLIFSGKKVDGKLIAVCSLTTSGFMEIAKNR